jgi:RNase P subunit RPR2
MEEKKIICRKCNLALEPKEITFRYMGFHFNHTLPACPACGQVYLSEDVVNGKVKEIELLLEEK